MNVDLTKWTQELALIFPAVNVCGFRTDSDELFVRIKIKIFDFDEYIHFSQDIDIFAEKVRFWLISNLRKKIKYVEGTIAAYKHTIKMLIPSQFTWLTSSNTNKLHAIPTVGGELKIGCRSICGIGPHGKYSSQIVKYWYVGPEGLDKCKNCLRKIKGDY